ncbi:MAG: YgiT-type zinc finger protein [Deltaproteobacteria bacterium]|nr:YgiT-type zinc finger protein [Deltaproteobacteria bacterium]
MSRPDRMISASDVRMAIEQGELVEDYPEDAWGHSCLIPAWVCTQCGEAYFDEAEVEAIQEVLGALDQQSEKLAASG